MTQKKDTSGVPHTHTREDSSGVDLLDQIETIAAETPAEINLTPDSFSWTTKPADGELTHTLNIKVPMNTAERNAIEYIIGQLWDHTLTISGVPRPKQGELFSNEQETPSNEEGEGLD